MSAARRTSQGKSTKRLSVPPCGSLFERGLVVVPRLPIHEGIFHLGPLTLIAAHPPHAHVAEHLHDHLPHLHIRYGFELPRQPLDGIPKRGAALQVAMWIKITQRVDCNPVFVARGNGAEGICLKIAGEDIHWVHDAKVSRKATKLFEATGRKMPDDGRFIGFSTSDISERHLRRYSAAQLREAIGSGLRVDQHFQATWIEPCDDPIEPYTVTICLSDDATDYHAFFELPPTVALGAF